MGLLQQIFGSSGVDPYEKGEAALKEGNYFDAVKWFQVAVESGDMYAMNDLALLYYQGKGIPQDLYKAEELYRMSIALGHDYAKFNFAQMILNHAEADGAEDEAFSLLLDLAENSNEPRAQRYLGMLYERGVGTEQDLELSEYWYSRAEQQGVYR